jgi:hypothetical protein
LNSNEIFLNSHPFQKNGTGISKNPVLLRLGAHFCASLTFKKRRGLNLYI